jgi:hypothetical protein
MSDILSRKDKVDPADAENTDENFLPGQIPVEDAQDNEPQNPEERQPDPVQAEKAVNPKDLMDVEGRKPA